MSAGAYVNPPERRIKHIKEVLQGQPRRFDATVIGAGTTDETVRDARNWYNTVLPKKLPYGSQKVIPSMQVSLV